MRSLKAKQAETASEESAGSEGAPQVDGALGADVSGKTPEGDTAAHAGKGDESPDGKQTERDGSIPEGALKARLKREKEKQEKLNAENSTLKLETAKMRKLFEAAVAENERLSESLRQGAAYDERGEELQSLKIQREMEQGFLALKQEHEQALKQQVHEMQVAALTDQLRSEVAAACEKYPSVSSADIRSSLRSNPSANALSIAQAIHEQRAAYFAKQGAPAAAQQLPTTVAKPSGASTFQYSADRNGMAAAIRAARAKG